MMMPMMTSTTRSSSSVKPDARARCGGPPGSAELLRDVPVADIGIRALATGLVVGAERIEVVVTAARARRDVSVIVAPGILLQRAHVTAIRIDAHVRVVGPCD